MDKISLPEMKEDKVIYQHNKKFFDDLDVTFEEIAAKL